MAEASEYIYAQIIFDPNLLPRGGSEYITSYIDSAQTPNPVVLGTNPLRTRTGDHVTVFATGVGNTQGTYNGRIEAQDDQGVWYELLPNSWTYVAASADAYGVDRMITDDMAVVDVEHVEVSVDVPAWGTPPNLPLRAVTDTT